MDQPMETSQTTAQPHDPVCGMTVNPEVAGAAGLTAEHEGQSYYFCSTGCKLEFLEDPKRFFDPEYLPHM
jgi:YHS domain-containing protein